MGRAVIYTRVSSKAQEDGYSLEVQERDGQSYCKTRGHAVVAVESDTFTGHDSLEERDGMQAAIKRIKHGEADTLVIWRVDRSARFMLDNLLLLREVSDAGGSFESVTEGVIPNTPMGKLMLSVHSFAGESEWESIRDRTQAGLTARIGKGHILVAPVPMYGYVYVGERKETYAPDPDAAPVVQDIYAKADAGWSSRRIARWLHEQGIPTASMLLYRRGELPASRRVAQAWSTQMVLDILRNESYTGRHAARKYTTTKDKVRLEDGRVVTVRHKHIRPETDERRVALTIPALVSAEQWQRVQEQLNGRHLEREEEPTDAPLLSRGFAVCGVCGGRMVTVRRKDWKARRYMCSYRATTCTGHGYAVKAPEVDADTWEKVKEIVRDDEKYTRLVEGKSARLAARHAEARQRAGLVSRELAETREKQATVFRRMNDERDDSIAAMYRQELQHLNETVAGLEKRASETQDVLDAAQGKQDEHRALLASIDGFLAEGRARDPDGRHAKARRWLLDRKDEAEGVALDSLDREQRRGILRLLGVQVLMYPVDSKYVRDNPSGPRWDFHFGRNVHRAKGTSYGYLHQVYSWEDWLSA